MSTTTTNHLINLWISSTDSYSERRFSPHLTIGELRSKLQPITGIPAQSQKLALINPSLPNDQHHSIILQDDRLTLSDYQVQQGATIDVVDINPSAASQAGQYNDLSLVEKFELPREEYEKRPDSLLAFKIRNKLGRFNDQQTHRPELPEPSSQQAPTVDDLVNRYPIGARCQLNRKIDNSLTSDQARGTVRFVGPVEFNTKFPVWIGVELDEPTGKNDGSVDGQRYFSCPPCRGIFVQPERVEVGNFPPIDPLEDDEEI